MFKRSASRTQRSKGVVVRAKQILQILLLLGICFWLVYQVKYSHDKKKAILDEKDSKISHKEQDDNLGLKFGRKDLPRVYAIQHKPEEEEDEDEGNTKLEDDEHEQVREREEVEESNVGVEDDVKKEVDSEEDDVKKAHEEVELEEDEKEEEEEEVKNDEPENHEKPGEVEVEEEEEMKELEEREQEKPQEEGDDHEEFIDEEKEKEEDPDEKENDNGNGEEVKNKQVEDDTNVEDEEQDRDEISREVHEAREEHYKGDDASSAVTLDKSSVPSNESTTVEIIEKSSESESSNGSEDHGNAIDVEIRNSAEANNSADANTTELANSSPTDETEMGNAANVSLNVTLTETEEASMDKPTSDPEVSESSSNHTEGTISLVGSDSNLRLPSNTTESSETNTRDEDPGGHNEAGGVGTD